jgi:membrane-associated protease RseP (regulator of RpoE activity)
MRLALLISLTALALSPTPAAAEGSWPFGEPRGSGPWSRLGQDLYNLGPIGAKARDADRPPPAAPTSGTRRIPMAPRPPKDEGPTRLAVAALLSGGPAETAGLLLGDVIVGIGKKKFREGSLTLVAEALRKAESKDGKVTLLVKREGEKGTLKLVVEIEAGGKAAAKPAVGEGRVATVKKALAWLAERQDRDGGFGAAMSGTNQTVVVTSLAGLAWLAGGSDARNGPYAENVAKAVAYVSKNAGQAMRLPGGAAGMSGLDQTNWGCAHAAIFLGELCARMPDDRDLKRTLSDLGASLAERQERSGGWAHGPGGPNPLGYTELNIVSGLALCGMGLATHSGWTPPKEVVEKAEAYLIASSGGDGGVGYSDQPGQKGMGNIGRTAGAWLGYRTLKLVKRPWYKKMGRYVGSHVGDVLDGHASLMQHILLAGVAAHAHGKEARKRYWAALERDLILARAPDGSLQPRPWHESTAGGTNSDVTTGEAWTTAAWTIVLACPPGEDGLPGLPAWMAMPAPRRR